jgi:predicted dehydrogenase
MLNRRDFVKSTVLAGAAVRSAAAGRVAPSDQVTVAVIGVKGRGGRLSGDFAALPDANIAYLCDVDERVFGRALKAVEEKKGKRPQLVGDLRRVLDDKSVDAVIIATPDHWHAPAAILACAAGKDVYVEKPCSHNLREGRLLVEAARKYKRVVQHGTQARSRAPIQRAIEYVRAGKLGEVLAAKAWNVQMRDDIGRKPDSPVPPGLDFETWTGPALKLPFNENRFHYKWHWNWNYGTGDVGNDGVHQMDMARWALGVGAPTEVSGMGCKLYFQDDQQTPDTVNLTFRYPNNGQGREKVLLFEMRIWNPYGMDGMRNGVAVYGSQGVLHLGTAGFKVFDGDGKLVLHDDRREPDTHAQNFLDCVRSRQAPNAEIEIGHVSSLHCHLGNIVARTGRGLKFDPRTETVIGDADAGRYLRREYRQHWATPQGA